VAASFHNLGWLAQDEGEFAEARRLYKLARDIRRRHLGDDHWLVTATTFNLAWVTAFQFDQITSARQREAEELIREVMRRQAKWPDRGHGDPVVTRLALAFLIYSHGDSRRGEVEGILREALVLLPTSRLAGPILATMVKYASAKQAREAFRLDEAVRLNREVIEDARRVFGRDHAVVAYLLGDLAGMQNQAGDAAGAEATIKEALRIGRRLYPGGHWLLAKTLAEVGEHFRGLNRPKDAEEHFREGMAVAVKCRRPDLFRRSRDGLADLLRTQGRGAEADAARAAPEPPDGKP
jgi:hypothetical protein